MTLNINLAFRKLIDVVKSSVSLNSIYQNSWRWKTYLKLTLHNISKPLTTRILCNPMSLR